MNRYSVLVMGLFSIFCLGCVEQQNPTPADKVSFSALAQTQISSDNKLKEKQEKEYQEAREMEEQSYQAMFRNQKWIVVSVEEYDRNNAYKWLWFKTLDGGYFRSSAYSVKVVLDESLNGTYLVVSGVGRSLRVEVDANRYVDQAVLYVSTRANKRHWDNYLKSLKEEIEKSESPREVSPPGKSK